MPDVIEIEGLSKAYRRRGKGLAPAVDGLDLWVPAGGVFGFLGPNGAGKTTTIRCLLGLVRPGAGHLKVLGAESPRQLPTVIARIGSLFETPAFFPGFSGKRNLLLLGRTQGIGPKAVEDVLEHVGLSDRARDPVRAYSQGMRQRLGIAAALLRDPELLILDEPANGLDPAGIKATRDLLRHLGREGRTVFVSSHLLSEVQHMCDRVAILARGRLVTTGSVDEVLAGGQAGELVVRLDDPDGGMRALGARGIRATRDGVNLVVHHPPEEAATVTRVLAESGLYLSELRPREVDLETVFLQLTGQQQAP